MMIKVFENFCNGELLIMNFFVLTLITLHIIVTSINNTFNPCISMIHFLLYHLSYLLYKTLLHMILSTKYVFMQ